MILMDPKLADWYTSYVASYAANTAATITVYSDAVTQASLNTATAPSTGKLITYAGVGLAKSSAGFVKIGVFAAAAQSATATAAGTAKWFHLKLSGGEWFVGEIGVGHAMQLANGNAIALNEQKKIQSFAFKFTA